MELAAFVVAFLAEFDEVFAGLRDVVAMELEVDRAQVRDQPDVALLLHPCVSDDVLFENRSLVNGLSLHGRRGEGGCDLSRRIVGRVDLVGLRRHFLLVDLDIARLEGFLKLSQSLLGLEVDLFQPRLRVGFRPRQIWRMDGN